MGIKKVILYYGFAPVTDPYAVKLWQLALCESLNLKGRILISPHGINGTLGGDMQDLKKYVKTTRQFPGFKKIDFKWSNGTGNDFPRLKVTVKKELVSFGHPDEIQVDVNGVINGGVHLKPKDVHKLVEERGDEVVFFDGRNAFEAKIGKFKNAVVPDTVTSHDFVKEIESGKYDHLKSNPIVTYCTGGIRCEILSAVMKNRGFQEVYQIEGGIVRYGDKYKDSGFWEGSLYTFDNRMTIDFSKEAKVIGQCEKCQSPTKDFYNCAESICNELILLCDPCSAAGENLRCTHSSVRSNRKELIG